MKIHQSFLIAFSTYSAIPMPHADWKLENMRYSLCFFPLIGLIIGGLLWGWTFLCTILQIGSGLFAAAAAAIPVLVSGGIHLDGFCDTADALASHQSREKKIEILKDSHAGAFAIIFCVLYFLLQFGFWTEWTPTKESLCILAGGFVLSRSLSAFAATVFPRAKKQGLLAAFSNAAATRGVVAAAAVYFGVCAFFSLWANPVMGGAVTVISLAALAGYYGFSQRQFGGVTGDLAGFFLQVCELLILGTVVLVQKIQGVWFCV